MNVPVLSTLFVLLSASAAQAAPGPADVDRAATRVAGVLDGVLRGCPASFAGVGTGAKRCVGAGASVEAARAGLSAALRADLHGVWRSRDDQRSVYNWLGTPGGYVYLRVQPDPQSRARSLVYVDLPPDAVPAPGTAGTPAGSVTLTRVTPPAPQPQPARQVAQPPAPAATPAVPTAGTPFRRTLALMPQRMHGADVRAVQNRLIRLTSGGQGSAQGDGWYGPVTTATVRAFQRANGLAASGRVDRATWDALFSATARPFQASDVR